MTTNTKVIYSTETHRFTRYGSARDQHFDLAAAHLRPSRISPSAWVYLREDAVCPGSALLFDVKEARARGMVVAFWDDLPPHLEIRAKDADLSETPLLALYFTGVYGEREEDIECYLRMQQENEARP